MDLTDLVDGYQLGKCLSSGSRSVVYAGTRLTDGLEVVLKVFSLGASASAPAATREYEALRACAGAPVPRALELRTDDLAVLVLESLPGSSLAAALGERLPSTDEALELAIGLAGVIEAVHAQNVLHLGISPAHAWIASEAGSLHLLGFGSARRRGASDTDGAVSASAGLDVLAYVPPERTGWVAHGCDFRSDLYALGATLYWLVAGRPPFLEEDPNKLVHAHVAREPVPLHEVRPGVPEVLSRVVARLLRKEPADRYASATSVRLDLEQIWGRLSRGGELDRDLELGRSGEEARPRIGSRLHGRARELDRLESACRHLGPSSPRVVLLRGPAGAGKSSLLHAIRPSVARMEGYLAVGEFAARGGEPYEGLAEVLRSLVARILRESRASFQQWQDRMSQALGGIARALEVLAPDVNLVTPDAPPVAPLDARKTRERLALAFERFLRAFAADDRRLVILLDDLQWADQASLDLMRHLVRSGDLPGILVVATLTDDLDAEAPIVRLVEGLGRQPGALETIEVGPLEGAAVEELLGDALRATPDEVAPLGAYVSRATRNLPLLMVEVIDHLYEEGLLRREEGRLQVDLAAIEAVPLPDGVGALIASKIRGVDAEEREALEVASCLGSDLSMERILEASELPAATLVCAIYRLIDEGIFVQRPGGLRLAHERVGHAVRAACSPPRWAEHHQRIARRMLVQTSALTASDLFALADHLRHCGDSIPEELRRSAIEVGARAGRAALERGASAEAARYLEAAHARLRESDWQERGELAFELGLDWVESLTHTGEIQAALDLLQGLERQQRSEADAVRIAVKRIVLYALVHPSRGALYALEVLRGLGYRWPLRPSLLRTRLSLRQLGWKVGGREIEECLRPAECPDPERMARLAVVEVAIALFSRIDVRLTALLAASALRWMLRDGYVSSPAVVLSTVGVYTRVLLGRARLSREYSEAALRFAECVPDPLRGPRAEYQVLALLGPWHGRRRRSLPALARSARRLGEAGDLEWQTYARFVHGVVRVLAGDPLLEVEQELGHLVLELRVAERPTAVVEDALRLCRWLSRRPPSSEELDVAAARARGEGRSASGLAVLHTLELLVLLVHGQHARLRACAWPPGRSLAFRQPHYDRVDHTLYRGIACAQLAPTGSAWRRRQLVRDLRRCRRAVRGWAEEGPDFRHMALLLDAEQARLAGQTPLSLRLYRDAGQEASDQEFLHHAALASELRGRLLARVGRVSEALRVLEEAVHLYVRWGAHGKAVALDAERLELGRPLSR